MAGRGGLLAQIQASKNKKLNKTVTKDTSGPAAAASEGISRCRAATAAVEKQQHAGWQREEWRTSATTFAEAGAPRATGNSPPRRRKLYGQIRTKI